MSTLFDYSNSFKTRLEPRIDADGKVFRECLAHGALTALTPYRINYGQYGAVSAAMSSVAKYYRVIIPLTAVADATVFEGQTGGYIANVVTPSISMSAGHAFSMDAGVVADDGAWAGDGNEFATSPTAQGTGTTKNMFLLDREILGET